MSELALSAPQPIAPPRERSRPGKVTGKLRRALELMVWECKKDNEAAAAVRMDVLSIRKALEKPHVRAFYRAQRDVLRERESPANIHRLIAIRDSADNMPAVNAIKMLEQLGDEVSARSMGSVVLPGLTIQIITQSADVLAHTPQAPNVAQVIDNTETEQS